MKKQSLAALIALLLIPLFTVLGGVMLNFINPESAAGHPNYERNFHLLTRLRITLFLASLAVAALLWIVACFLVIRSKKQSYLWMPLAALGPLGFAVLAALNDRAPTETDRYSRFLRNLNAYVRVAYELFSFVVIWVLAFQAMLIKRVLMIGFDALASGVSTSQVMNIQNASSGMWAFGGGMEVMYFVALFYMLRPIVFSFVGQRFATRPSPKPS
jgi:hypothetical protein